MAIFTLSDNTLQVTLLLFPESSMMCLASTLDTMRAANRIAGQSLFRWKIATLNDNPSKLTCGLSIAPDVKFDEVGAGDVLFVIAGFNPLTHVTRQQLNAVKLKSTKYDVVGGIESGSWVIAQCGLLDGKNATTHWEDQEDFALQFPRVKLKSDRFVIDGNVFTTGGASPTFDFMLHLIRIRSGYPLALEISSAFIYDGGHNASDTQALVSLGRLENHDPRVAQAIQIMGRHIDETILISDIATELSISVRMLEYLFKQTMALSPAAFYRRIRLQTARRLVVDTRLRLREVAIRTGFNSLPAFSRMFKRYYKQSPGECRRQAGPGG